MGASIICEALFNQKTKFSKRKKPRFYDYLEDKYSNTLYKAPIDTNKKITAILVAPAISGLYTFKDYYNRGEGFSNTTESYQFIIGYNINDPVLRKNVASGFISKLAGLINSKNQLILANPSNSTSLGCLESEKQRVENLFKKNYDRSKIEFIDFSFATDQQGRKSANAFHEIEKYLATPQYETLIKKAYNIKKN